MNRNIKRKTILVTGASGGLGIEICRQLNSRGHRVLASVTKFPASKELESLSNGDIFGCDFNDLPEVEKLADLVLKISGGKLDCLVNNAGIGFHSRASEIELQELEATFFVNALAPILLMSRLLPTLSDRNGHIVNIASKLVDATLNYTSVYTASKRALAGYSAVVRAETGLRMTSIEPGAMETNFLRHTHDHPAEEHFTNRKLERLSPASVAALAVETIENPSNVLIERIQVVPSQQVL